MAERGLFWRTRSPLVLYGSEEFLKNWGQKLNIIAKWYCCSYPSRHPSVSFCLPLSPCDMTNICLPSIFSSPLPANCLPSFRAQIPILSPQLRMTLQASIAWLSSGLCEALYLQSHYFSPVNLDLAYATLVIRPAKEPTGVEEKSFRFNSTNINFLVLAIC